MNADRRLEQLAAQHELPPLAEDALRVLLGLVCGDLVARAILGDRDPALDLFDPARWPAPSSA